LVSLTLQQFLIEAKTMKNEILIIKHVSFVYSLWLDTPNGRKASEEKCRAVFEDLKSRVSGLVADIASSKNFHLLLSDTGELYIKPNYGSNELNLLVDSYASDTWHEGLATPESDAHVEALE
jgi:hypothetical protein